MDYSLLVGLDHENNLFVTGIVGKIFNILENYYLLDYIRTYTWDKKLESWVKESGFLGGGRKEPTIITPRQYKKRFREAMLNALMENKTVYRCA